MQIEYAKHCGNFLGFYQTNDGLKFNFADMEHDCMQAFYQSS